MTVNDSVRGTGDGPAHGTDARTRGPYFCHCPDACEPFRAVRRRREKRRLYDRTQGVVWRVDPARVATFIADLHAQGVAYTAIARATGVSKSVIHAVVHGQRTLILRSVEQRILGVDVGALLASPVRSHVDATGTVRRIRGMAANGHTFRSMADELGVTYQHISELANGHPPGVTRMLADRVRRLYDTWSMTLGPSVRNRRRAVTEGWAPPIAWEYVDIDDPAAVPTGVRRRRHVDHAKAVA